MNGLDARRWMQDIGSVSDSRIANECILPAQWWAMMRSRRLSPEQKLLWSLLEDALRTVSGAGTWGSHPNRRLAAQMDDRLWFESDAFDDPKGFTFLGICEYLGLSPAVIRTAVRANIIPKLTRCKPHNGGRGRVAA